MCPHLSTGGIAGISIFLPDPELHPHDFVSGLLQSKDVN
jgi:hypothetical protein